MTQSEELFARAQRLIPGGVNSPVRAFKAVGGTPLFIRKAEGAMKWDDITLERRIDSSQTLWEWRKQVIDGNIDDARAACVHDLTRGHIAGVFHPHGVAGSRQ